MAPKDQIRQAFQQIVAEASEPTPSGNHRMFVVGQIVVNVQSESQHRQPCPGVDGCCGRCQK
jgi:hypothetical protein